MDHEMDYDDGKAICVWCRRVFDPERTKPICGDCVCELDETQVEAERLSGRVRYLIDHPHGFRPSLVLLMAVVWLTVTFMESLP